MSELNPYAQEVVKSREEMITEVQNEIVTTLDRLVYLEGYLQELQGE